MSRDNRDEDLYWRLMQPRMQVEGDWFSRGPHTYHCPMCGPVEVDGRDGYIMRHLDSPEHYKHVTHHQSETRKAARLRWRDQWMEMENRQWLTVRVVETMTIGEMMAERADWADVEDQWLVSFKQTVRYHVPLPGRPLDSLCGLTFKPEQCEVLPVSAVTVGVAAFKICGVCDSDGKLQEREMALIQAELMTCPYCLGEFKSVEARREHEEECGL